VTQPKRDNVLIVHWHDLGRYLGVYGHSDVSSPHLDRLAAEGFLFTRAHSTAPLCSPSRGSLFTGRYPQSNGLLGFDEFDVSNSYCEYVVERASRWLEDPPPRPFLLTAGFFETHRPYPRDRYEPADATAVTVPDYLPDTSDVRQDLADFYGAITVADAAVGRLLDTLSATGLDRNTWVVFMTDHGPALPRAKSTLYDAGTGIAMIIRPPRDAALTPRVYDELFSGVDLLPTLLELLGIDVPDDVEGISHAQSLTDTAGSPVRTEVYTTKTYHDSFDPIRAVRTKEYSYIENYASRPLLDLPWDIAESAPGQAVAPAVQAPRPDRELYDLVADPTESQNLLGPNATDKAELIANDLALLLNDWRVKTNDVIPSEFAGTRISERYTETYMRIHGPTVTSRSAIAAERGIEEQARRRE
jgi:arylsulfatase A-like enzyme